MDYLAAVAAVGLLLLALVAVREHRPERRPAVNPVGHIGALVRPPAVRRPPAAAPSGHPRPDTRPPRRPPPPRVTVLSPSWAVGW